MPEPTLTLWYGTLLVGHLRDVYCSDATWYGRLDRSIQPNNDLSERVVEFIKFCEDWNQRMEDEPRSPPDAAEFDQYSDLLTSGQWAIKNAAEETSRVRDAPVFFVGGEISWRVTG